MAGLHGKDLVSIGDLSKEEILSILDLAAQLKNKQKTGVDHKVLPGKTLAMIFEKPSTRTLVSFQVGMWQLGGHALNLSPDYIQAKVRESIADVARTLSRYVDGIMIRTFSHDNVLEFAKYATVPVINGLSDLSHPCQGLSDIFTIMEKKGKENLKKIKIAYVGDGNNVCHALVWVAAKMGLNFVVAAPKGYEPDEGVTEKAFDDAKSSGAVIEILNDPVVAAGNADVIYTDVWASMGQEGEKEKRKAAFRNFQVNSKLLELAKPDAIVMHCLPAHRGEEITDEVIEGPSSVVFDQAENRLHVQKAILALLLG